jgi:protein translocase SecG subunit
VLSNFLLVIVYASSIALIGLVAAQTTKSEGLSGAIGGHAQSNTKYLPGSEESLQRWTTYIASIWMFCCLLWFLLSSRAS